MKDNKSTKFYVFPNENDLWTLKVIHLDRFYEKDDYKSRQDAINNIKTVFEIINND